MLLPEIRKVVPPHKLCLDLFGGGGAFILDDSHETGVYNDINENAVNFFRVLRDPEKGRELRRVLELTPYSRSEYFSCDESLGDSPGSVGGESVEWARRWFVVINMGFTHEEDCHSFRVGNNNIARAVRNHVDRLPLVIDKLRNVTIENLDFRRALNIWGKGKDTLIFADPPYISSKGGDAVGYKHQFTLDDHIELLKLLSTSQCMVILCGYDSEIYHAMLDPSVWSLVKKVRVAQVGNSGYVGREFRVEHIWVKRSLGGLFDAY